MRQQLSGTRFALPKKLRLRLDLLSDLKMPLIFSPPTHSECVKQTTDLHRSGFQHRKH
ncbi:hypothetical protein ACVWZP_001472 [Pseudomonas sp. TE36184]